MSEPLEHLDALLATLSREQQQSCAKTIRAGTLASPRARGSFGSMPPQALPKLAIASEGNPLAQRADLLVRSTLGEGGMGRIELARQPSLGRDVALKRVRGEHPSSQNVAALIAEARTTGSLEHPNVVPVHALGLDDHDDPVLIMKRVEGASLAAMLADPEHPLWPSVEAPAQGRLAAQVGILGQVCRALELAHARSVLHLDVKPENVMVGAFGEVYLVDWGVALHLRDRERLEAEGPGLVGTPVYMAPEMVLGRPTRLDPRTDVYLLGATLHEMLTGSARHAGESLLAVLENAATSAPFVYDETVPADLAALCNAACHADPAQRPESVTAFRHALVHHLDHRGSIALSTSAARSLEDAERIASAGADGLVGDAAWEALSVARYGFAQALRSWPDNQQAHAGLETTLDLLVQRELALRNPRGAAALLSEMRVPEPERRAEISRLELALEEAHQRRSSPETLPATAIDRLRGVLLLASLPMIVLPALPLVEHGPYGPPMRYVVLGDLAMTLSAILVAWLFRRTILATRNGRALTLLGIVGMAFATLSDLQAWLSGLPHALAAPRALLCVALAIAPTAVFVLPSLWAAIAVAIAASIAATLMVEHASFIASIGFVSCTSLVAWLVGRFTLRRFSLKIRQILPQRET